MSTLIVTASGYCSCYDTFTNDGFLQLNGVIRLEVTIINQIGNNFKINTGETMTISNNSRVQNYGVVNVLGAVDVSSLIEV